jgi:hypothetical protein
MVSEFGWELTPGATCFLLPSEFPANYAVDRLGLKWLLTRRSLAPRLKRR